MLNWQIIYRFLKLWRLGEGFAEEPNYSGTRWHTVIQQGVKFSYSSKPPFLKNLCLSVMNLHTRLPPVCVGFLQVLWFPHVNMVAEFTFSCVTFGASYPYMLPPVVKPQVTFMILVTIEQEVKCGWSVILKWLQMKLWT